MTKKLLLFSTIAHETCTIFTSNVRFLFDIFAVRKTTHTEVRTKPIARSYLSSKVSMSLSITGIDSLYLFLYFEISASTRFINIQNLTNSSCKNYRIVYIPLQPLNYLSNSLLHFAFCF